jgi:hypothetical protein
MTTLNDDGPLPLPFDDSNEQQGQQRATRTCSDVGSCSNSLPLMTLMMVMRKGVTVTRRVMMVMRIGIAPVKARTMVMRLAVTALKTIAVAQQRQVCEMHPCLLFPSTSSQSIPCVTIHKSCSSVRYIPNTHGFISFIMQI